MAKIITPKGSYEVDTCHNLNLFCPDRKKPRQHPDNKKRQREYLGRLRRLGIFVGAVVHVSKVVLDEAKKAGVGEDEIRAIHEELGAVKVECYSTDEVTAVAKVTADAEVMLTRHGKLLHEPDNMILAWAKHRGCDLCTCDVDLAEVAPAEGVQAINPDRTFGSLGCLYVESGNGCPGTRPGKAAGYSDASTANRRRRLPRRRCPPTSSPRYRLVPGRPAPSKGTGA